MCALSLGAGFGKSGQIFCTPNFSQGPKTKIPLSLPSPFSLKHFVIAGSLKVQS